jgi:hypothetical protein
MRIGVAESIPSLQLHYWSPVILDYRCIVVVYLGSRFLYWSMKRNNKSTLQNLCSSSFLIFPKFFSYQWYQSYSSSLIHAVKLMRSFALRSMKPLPDTTPTSMNWITILVESVTLYRKSWLSCRQWESPNPIAHLTGKSIRLQLEIIPTTGLPLQTLLVLFHFIVIYFSLILLLIEVY